MMQLPYYGHLPKDIYTTGCWVSRNERKYLVNVRTPDGGFVKLAEYRTHWAAARFVHRSWKLALQMEEP